MFLFDFVYPASDFRDLKLLRGISVRFWGIFGFGEAGLLICRFGEIFRVFDLVAELYLGF